VPRTRLRETLEELESELEQAEALAPQSRERLAHVLGEVRELLGEDVEPREEHRSLLDRLREATREFEEEHPALAETVGRVATALSNLGI
jgi:predicted  nucleic acid-binding Zn-ribbon protein